MALLSLTMDAQHQEQMPFAEVALPSWFFTKVPEVYGDVELQEGSLTITTAHLQPLTTRITTALHRAGFRRSATKEPRAIMSAHGERSMGTVRFGGPGFAPLAALQQSTSGPNKPLASVVVEWIVAGELEWLSVWFDPFTAGTANQWLGCSRWRTWKAIPADEIPIGPAEYIAHALKSVAGAPDKAGLEVTLKGEGWCAATKGVLQYALTAHNLSYDIVDPVISDYAAALQMAREARETLTGYFACFLPGPSPEDLEPAGQAAAKEDREL